MNNPTSEMESDSSAQEQQQDLLQYYGLSSDPFENVSEVFLLTPKLEKLLRLLNYLTRFSHKTLVITAEAGVGKTQIAQQFLSGLDEDRDFCQIDGLADDTPTQMLHELAEQCGLTELESASIDELLTDLDRYAQDLQEDGRRCVVLIDDADLLNANVLGTLYDLVKPRENQIGPWHLVLFGRPVLEHNLSQNEQVQEDSRHLFHYQLSRFSYKECCQYLQICFARAGDQSKIPFEKADYLRIYQNSGGVPQAIISEARQLLEEGVDRLMGRSTAPKWIVSSAVAFSLVAVVLLGFFFWEERNNANPVAAASTGQNSVTQVTGKIERQIESPANLTEGLPKDAAKDIEQLDQAVVNEAAVVLETNQSEINGAPDAATPEPLASAESSIEEPVAESDEVQNVSLAAVHGNDLDNGTIGSAGDTGEDTAKQNTEEIAVAPLEVSQGAEASGSINSTAGVGGPVVVSSAEGYAAFSASENTILSWAANDYTLQLLGARTEKQVLDYIAPVSELDNIEYFRTELNGAPWFVVVLGNFSTRADALAASRNLPAALGKTNPWVRRIKGIQRTLQERVDAPQISQH